MNKLILLKIEDLKLIRIQVD